jgi:hypothetical protein
LAVVLYVRLRLLDLPLERDEGEYAYAGQLILDKLPPYQLAYNMKMPGTYLAYAAIMAIFGQTASGIHLGLLVVVLTTSAVLFLVAKRFLGLSGAALATSAYALMTLSPAMLGLAGHATHFVVLPALLGIWMLLRFESQRRWLYCLASGCFFGIAFLMKQPGIFFGLFGGIYLAQLCVGRDPPPVSSQTPRQRAASVALPLGSFAVGCVLPFLVICAWLKIAGVFPRFWFWTTTYAREYATMLTLSEGVANAQRALGHLFLGAPLLWVIAALGFVLLCTTRMELNRRLFFAGLLVFSCLAVCPGFYFREHYFIVLVPSVALLIGLAVSWSEARFAPASWLRVLPLVLGVLACAESLSAYREVLFTLSPKEASRATYGANPFPESLDIARYIQQNTNPDDRIVVIGSEPQIYFYSRRLSSTGYIYMYPLTEPQPFAKQMQEEMIREIEQNPPAYLVFIAIPTSWLMRPESSGALIDWVPKYAEKNMQLVGLIQFTDSESVNTVWGSQAATTPLQSPLYISIFKKN